MTNALGFHAVVLVIATALISGCERSLNRDPDILATTEVFSSETIATAEFICFPPEIYVTTALTQQSLSEGWRYKITIRDFQNSSVRERLRRSISAASISKRAYTPDLRWGCLLYDSDGELVVSAFLDGGSSSGYAGSKFVEFDGKLQRLFNDLFSPVR